jgi:hypothetical protein
MSKELKVVGVEGFEPPTAGFRDRRSRPSELHTHGKCYVLLLHGLRTPSSFSMNRSTFLIFRLPFV